MARAPYGQTPWQTVGPFFHFGLPWSGCADLTGHSGIGARPDLMPTGRQALRGPDVRPPEPSPRGERIEINGRVFDAQGVPVPDALLEIWQANANGQYRGSAAFPRDDPADDPAGEVDLAFFGFGRAATAENGSFCFRTLRPGRVPFAAGHRPLQAPHIALGVQGRGLLKRLVTRIYFADESSNAEDPILARVPEHRRATLLAERVDAPHAGAAASYRFDVHLQGARETVFFEW